MTVTVNRPMNFVYDSKMNAWLLFTTTLHSSCCKLNHDVRTVSLRRTPFKLYRFETLIHLGTLERLLLTSVHLLPSSIIGLILIKAWGRIYASVILPSLVEIIIHYRKQCWVVVNCTLRNKLQWNLNQNTHENAYQNIVWLIVGILSGGMSKLLFMVKRQNHHILSLQRRSETGVLPQVLHWKQKVINLTTLSSLVAP